MPSISNTTIFIEQLEIPIFQSLTIKQTLEKHHKLELLCRKDVLESATIEVASESKDFLGQTITVQAEPSINLADHGRFEFKGIITGIDSAKGFDHLSGDTILIEAKSTSIITDDGWHNASFAEMNLQDILLEVFSGYDRANLQTTFEPEYTDTILYSVQANESAFDYTKRLAAQYGEWFYFDGKTLVFGKKQDTDDLLLHYGSDLKEFKVRLMSTPNSNRYYVNNYLTEDLYESNTKDVIAATSGFNGFVGGKSDALFPQDSQLQLNTYTDNTLQQRLDRQVQQQKKATQGKQVIVMGNSTNQGVALGQVVNIQQNGGSHGRFRITEVSHNFSANDTYTNTFIGMNADIEVSPNTNINAFPKAAPMTAIVTDTNDPEKLGRVKVQFPFQRNSGQTTPWIRVMTPHSGRDKGFYFIPEINEEVLIGFEGNNAERPFVMGSMYTGVNAAGQWQTEHNEIKAIRTKSGHTILFNDKEGKESITVSDINENTIHIDTANNNMTIKANETLTMEAKNIVMRTGEDVFVETGGNMNTIIEGDISNEAMGDVVFQSQGNTTINAQSDIDITSSVTVKVTGQNVISEGQTSAKLKGQQTEVSGTVTQIKGASNNVNVT
ncbi:type VI secretion system Vgr family protein [Aquimarina algicola]|uniref:Gp5/Type VI secretion system Vgr protein OB-fold domain-containing protein n=1 Tax=Aquimarina algicola TaxID=2589995 RepID=A0A504J6N4_9FLAO|nr:phage baseplate assembly protein V [Aquimarina algicola]TPN82749.1 hypothetical protein FHK87_20185 [Aquimarina algicola]